MLCFYSTIALLVLMAGPALCSVLGHGCGSQLYCPQITGSCSDFYDTMIIFENTECPSCPVCIDDDIPLDENGCPDRKEFCEGAPPENCMAKRVFEYKGKQCNYCDADICVNYSNVQFVGANK